MKFIAKLQGYAVQKALVESKILSFWAQQAFSNNYDAKIIQQIYKGRKRLYQFIGALTSS